MLNWTQEDVDFVAEKIVMPIIKQLTEDLFNHLEKMDEIKNDSDLKMANIIADRIRESDYLRTRDRMFLMDVLSREHFYDKEKFNEIYDTYCKEYDKLNRHVLEDCKAVKSERC